MQVKLFKSQTNQGFPTSRKFVSWLSSPRSTVSSDSSLKGRCKVIFESDIGWIFLATSGNGGL